jgi:hypothetical protein
MFNSNAGQFSRQMLLLLIVPAATGAACFPAAASHELLPRRMSDAC